MLLISRTFRKSQITGTISFLLFSSIANSNVDGKSSLIIGGSHLHKTIGFGGKLSGRNIASVGTRMWPFFPILGSSRAPFRPFATNSSPDELECRQIEKALKIYDHMKVLECKPDLVTYNTVIGLLGRAGLVDDMLREFASMKKAKIIPDIVTYNTLLNHLQKMGRLDLCLLYMREVDENGLIPDLRTYTALIESFGRSGNIEEALRLFSAMKSRQVRPSIYTYRSLICNLKKMGMLSAAASLLDEMNLSLTNLVGPKNFKRKNR